MDEARYLLTDAYAPHSLDVPAQQAIDFRLWLSRVERLNVGYSMFGADARIVAPPLQSILRNIRKAMKPGARLLVLEAVMPKGDAPDQSKLGDVLMLIFSGGRERTEDEYRNLLARAGLRLDRVVPLPPTPWGTALIEVSVEDDPV